MVFVETEHGTTKRENDPMDSDQIGKKYDKVAEWWNKNHLHSSYGLQQIEKAIAFTEIKNAALDVGCGSGGRVIRLLEAHGFQVTGVDVSQKMLDIARRNHPGAEFHLSGIEQWENHRLFDLVVAWDSIFHIEAIRQADVIRKLTRKLQSRGILIYTFGDTCGDIEDLSFSSGGKQHGDLDNDYFGYGSIGINANLKALIDCGCKCLHLELDQFPRNHAYIIAQKQ